MTDVIQDRKLVIDTLRKELIGPWPNGEEIDAGQELRFETIADALVPHCQQGSGEEILHRDPPTRRYGIGVLYPVRFHSPEQVNTIENPPPFTPGPDENKSAEESHELGDVVEEIIEQITENSDAGGDDLDLSLANVNKPSSLGITFFIASGVDYFLEVYVSGGRYNRKQVSAGESNMDWWLREPVELKAIFEGKNIEVKQRGMLKPNKIERNNLENVNLDIELFVHDNIHVEGRLVTLCVINRSEEYRSVDEVCLFQTSLSATIHSKTDPYLILPYPESKLLRKDSEEKSNDLLYRKAMTYCVGHGCSGNWGEINEHFKARTVKGDALPLFEAPSITPEITDSHGNKVQVPMAELAGLVNEKDGLSSIEKVLSGYEEWIGEKRSSFHGLPSSHVPTAELHMQRCEMVLRRMKEGFNYLRSDKQALQAFRLANHAILLQQLRGKRERRDIRYDAKNKRLIFSEPFEDIASTYVNQGKAFWRPFQIAFLLYSAKSAVTGDDPDRDIVELIWFPTGGGKTEAYLALSAFSMFMRRIKDPSDCGVDVIMRYTLRLLTTQQFQRGSKLICAMEYLRRQGQNEILLGKTPFSIGIWVGDENTPNKRVKALENLRNLKSGKRYEQNKLLLDRCPWCRGQIGPVDKEANLPGGDRVIGYEQSSNTVVFKCRDLLCEFSKGKGIPVYVIDEDIYSNQPTMIIGTVDKFAMLAWEPVSRSIFGINMAGERIASPPSVIVQDELHLISGPLGSLVGLYETLIEELATDRRSSKVIVPKIICSTATIRRYEEQVKNLYGRQRVVLFPAPGIDYGESYFSRIARNEAGEMMPGRIYVGIHGPALGSMQTTQVRSFTALLQAPLFLKPEKRDPWWTLLVFFNSLRELGTTLSLVQSDIFDYFKVLQRRLNFEKKDMRKYWKKIKELTSRLRNDEVPRAITDLEQVYRDDKNEAIDVCLASSIIEVGIDIDRLSLMAVVGQPKTTSQYIQVTGRVGRQWWAKPGLVVTLYNSSKPRDRSHYEKFRSYHERLYSHVEPTSVTPFSPPVLDRALHAVMIAYVRQISSDREISNPCPAPINLLRTLQKIFRKRIEDIAPDQLSYFENVFEKRIQEWVRWENSDWTSKQDSEDPPLMHSAGSYIPQGWVNRSWAVPMSMRNVDSECQLEISQLFIEDEE